MKNFASIQILRAFASISVVFYHIDYKYHFGSFGVDIFFVISGFLMSMIVDSKISPGRFFLDRVSRIAPLYWMVTSILLSITFFVPQLLNSTSFSLANYFKSILFIPYFKENGALHPMLTVGWSLNYEFYFYLVITFVLLVFKRFWLSFVSLIIIFMLVISGYSSNNVVSTFLGNSIVIEFIYGIILFRILNFISKLNFGLIFTFVSIPLTILFLVYAELALKDMPNFIRFGIPSSLLVAFFLLAELNQGIFFKSFLLSSISKLGDSSYSLYLTHGFVIEAIRKLSFFSFVQLHSFSGMVFALFTSVFIGFVIFKYVDRPVYKYIKKIYY